MKGLVNEVMDECIGGGMLLGQVGMEGGGVIEG